jgi:PadR family transcriptional regulator PadR
MKDDVAPRWPAAWVRAALGTGILVAVEAGPLHGYGIAGALQRRGLGRPKGGSLYPLLAALEKDGSLEATWEQGAGGPGRRTYTLTGAGRRRLVAERQDWAALVAALTAETMTATETDEGVDDGDA